ncbi:conserved hypothetical protein [Pseudarthrobacter chlorophenolicus A6]|uniref:Uncharacterized protein n=1 Tax=Pseudarthrobacter chlorophenolicus (strain ATCC 700700 / DSM 12829 / CIP 107037 / JCM 12360 / KCTC 9906 / NCIMB 13794 / A6) TaxID=452863 RepID=B8HHH7_PSECP|nr:hypothetical protein [Pseudarthrobacter chlorophenolicus]ACL41468.1 conserved hypothetical protein [Pseudarthrobacter chlorophenolicus A6]SDQ63614.1 hypothetical protein SAMN04489738_1966 [Pseudarthrobacter chlorophenolicus]
MSDTAGSRSEGFVDQLLLEADLDDDGQLRPALLQLRALGADVPEPSAAVAALLERAQAAGSAEATAAPADPAAVDSHTVADDPHGATGASDSPGSNGDELAARRRAKRRAALTALTLGVTLTAGGAVAAASDQGIRDSFTQLNHAVTSFVTGSGPTGQRQAPLPSAQPADPAVPAPAAPVSPAAVPTAPAPVEAPAGAPASDAPAVPEGVQSPAVTPDRPAGVPAPGSLPTAVPTEVTDRLPQRPQVPLPEVPQLPLPTTLPAAPHQ